MKPIILYTNLTEKQLTAAIYAKTKNYDRYNRPIIKRSRVGQIPRAKTKVELTLPEDYTVGAVMCLFKILTLPLVRWNDPEGNQKKELYEKLFPVLISQLDVLIDSFIDGYDEELEEYTQLPAEETLAFLINILTLDLISRGRTGYRHIFLTRIVDDKIITRLFKQKQSNYRSFTLDKENRKFQSYTKAGKPYIAIEYDEKFDTVIDNIISLNRYLNQDN